MRDESECKGEGKGEGECARVNEQGLLVFGRSASNIYFCTEYHLRGWVEFDICRSP